MLDSCKVLQNQYKAFHIFCGIFPSLKQNFIAYSSSKVSSRQDCIFEIHSFDNQALVGCIPQFLLYLFV